MVLLKKIAKIILKILLALVAIFLLLVLLLQLSFVQNFVKDKAVVFLEGKINTKVAVGSIEIGLPKKVILHDFYFEDQAQDTLLAGKTLKIDIDLLKLVSSEVEINSIYLDGVTANIKVNKDSVFNFDYIIKAFETDAPASTEPTKFSIKNIDLDNIKFRYSDAVAKNSVAVFISHFDTTIKKFDLNNLDFNVPEINLQGLKLALNQEHVEVAEKGIQKVEENAETKVLKFQLKDINLKDFDISFKDAMSHIEANIQFKALKTEIKSIDLEQQIVVVNAISLIETKGAVTLTEVNKSANKVEESASNASNSFWKIDVNNIGLSQFNFAFDNNNAASTSKGIDFNHLKINDLEFKGIAFSMNQDAYNGTIKSLSFNEKSGVVLEALKTEFNYNTTGAFLKNLYLKTPQTTLQNSVVVSYPSVESISKNPENLFINATLKDSKLGFKDVLLLVPTLSSNDVFKNNPNAIISFAAVIKGKVDNLNIETFNAEGLGKTKVAINGSIKGLPNVEKSVFNLNILNFESTAKDIYGFVPKNTVPNTIQLPEKLNVKGNFKGGLNAFKTDLDLKTSLGNAFLEGSFDQSRKGDEKYVADASIKNFDLGTFIKNKQLGKMSVNATVNGRGLDPLKMTAKLNSKVISAKFNKYDYQNISLNGSINNGKFTANATSTDPNLNFVLDAEGSSNPEKPSVDLKLNIDLVDLNKLNLHAGPLKIKGNITANFDDLNPDNLNGILKANNFLIALEKEQFPLDTITVRAVSTIEKDSIILKSQFANGLITGNYKLSTISNQLINSFSKYYELDKPFVKNEEKQQLNFQFTIKDNPIIKKIVPEIIELSDISVTGKYNSVNDSIAINAEIPRLNYANNEISNGTLKVNTADTALFYNVALDNIKATGFEIPKTTLTGKIEGKTIDYNLNIKDLKNEDRYRFSGIFKDSIGNSVIRLHPEKLLLNSEAWTIHPDNFIKLEEKGLVISNFRIENKEQSLSIQSEKELVTAPININFNNFKLESLTSIAKSNFEVGGTIDGEATLKDLSSNLLFIADLDIENLRIKTDTIGNLNLKVDSQPLKTI